MKVLSVVETAIYVDDLDAAEEFYQRVVERVDIGKVLVIPVAKLSSDDRKWVREYERQSKPIETKQISCSQDSTLGLAKRSTSRNGVASECSID